MKRFVLTIGYFCSASLFLLFSGLGIGAWYLISLCTDNIVNDPSDSSILAIIVLTALVLIWSVWAVMNDAISGAQTDAEAKVSSMRASINQRETELSASVQNEYKKLAEKEKNLQDDRDKFDRLIAETKQSYPWLSSHISDLYYKDDSKIAYQLAHKKRAAISASKQVQEIAKEKRELMKVCKMLEYQIEFYETTFPWLAEFKELDPKQAWAYAKEVESDPCENDYFKNWLSPEEYAKYTPAERLQIKLDRYLSRKKSLWEVGIEYERYVGYIYESEGAKVFYQGARMKMEDMGRDLIVILPDRTLVIQCKRWSKEKLLHENSIFQLYGTTILLSIQDPKTKFEPIFITTSSLSETALQCANALNICVHENFKMDEDYPRIKCHVGRDGSKIYHLPFDQQYDRMHITKANGDCYVSSVAQAEELGFRHAYRWKGTNQTVN